MHPFDDEITRQVYETRFAPGIPEHVSITGHEVLRLLAASRSLQDVAVLGLIRRWPALPERLGILISGKWHATFTWIHGIGATRIKIERR